MPPQRRWADVAASGGVLAEAIAPGVCRLGEAAVAPAERSAFYLIETEDADILIDGGWGLCPGLEPLRRDETKPLVAIATHSHFDHIGLLPLASLRHAHEAERAVFADPLPQRTQALPYLQDRPVLADGSALDPASIRQLPFPIDVAVADDDVLDFGGTRLHVLHVPGHSPGSIALLDQRRGLLFSADTVHDGHIWDDIDGADRADLLASHARLATLDFATACPGHGALLPRPAFLDRIERYARMAQRRRA